MRAARIVYFILGIILLAPWLVYNIKGYLNNKMNKKKFPAGRIVICILVSAIMISGIYAHYRFTIGYQIPLVAERAGLLFSQRLEGKLDLLSYQKEMQRQNLSSEGGIITVSDEELDKVGFQQKKTNLLLSERVYPMEDGSMIVYLMYDDGQMPLYSFLQLKQSEDSWKVVLHDVLSQEEFEKLSEETKIKFYHEGS